MTDERKKFLASISKEEQIIRNTISMLKDYIGSYKGRNWSDDEKHLHRVCIRNLKIRIKALKKQLPVPKKYYIASNFVCCPVCNYILDSDCNDYYKNYCPDCGQRLR